MNMEQSELKDEYERTHATEAAAKVREELRYKLMRIVRYQSPSVERLVNEKTGEYFYCRTNSGRR